MTLMNNERELTEQDRQLLGKLEQILSDDSGEQREVDSLYGFCAHMASVVPQAQHSFRQQLENRLIVALQQGKSPKKQSLYRFVRDSFMPQYSWKRLRWALTVCMVLMILFGITVAIPQTRNVLAAWLGFSFDQQVKLQPLVVEALEHDWQSPLAQAGDKSFNVYSVEFPKDRWLLIEEAGFLTPEPGSVVVLPNGSYFPVPAYLPSGYQWQDITTMQGNLLGRGFPSLARQSWAGGGPPMPSYDLNVNYLIGGDSTNKPVILAEFELSSQQELVFQIFHADETRFGLVIQPPEAKSPTGFVFLIGSGDLSQTTVNMSAAWQYRGMWNDRGEWVMDRGWSNLVWEQGGRIYHLTGQDLSYAELISIAASISLQEVK
jgi:hypothetical protein